VKVDPEVIQTLVTFGTGGGLFALIAGIVRTVRTVRTGALSSTRAVVRSLVQARNEAEDREDVRTRERDYWRDIAGRYSFQLRNAGIRPDPPHPQPPRVSDDDRRQLRRERDERRIEDSGDVMA
jgi:hypothetical protein